jgi:hypothetical protein
MTTATQNDRARRRPGVLRQLAELERLSVPELAERWRALMDTAPARHNRRYLIKRLAYRIQELAYGGLTSQDRDRMERLLDAEGYDDQGFAVTKKRHRPVNKDGKFLPGTLLVREWAGERHEVRVLERGFEYRGLPYRSLSAVARLITGTQWSGPAFFGLRDGSTHGGGGHDA